jgi:hypothetical protein
MVYFNNTEKPKHPSGPALPLELRLKQPNPLPDVMNIGLILVVYYEYTAGGDSERHAETLWG